MKQSIDRRLVLVTGANGYVGSRLTRALINRGISPRCMVRRLHYMDQSFLPGASLVSGDSLDQKSLEPVLDGIHTAYYLIHSMSSDQDFTKLDRLAATNFINVAKDAGVSRIIYLGGLGDSSETLSAHLQSRQETGSLLRSSKIQLIEFRASVILGAGSLSFELIRNIVERLPVIIAPKWVSIKTQPIFIDDVIEFLIQALDIHDNENHIFEIGGKEILSYGDLMRAYAKMRGLKRIMIPVPFLSPRLSSYWLQFVTPLYARVGRKLIESLVNRTIINDTSADKFFSVTPTSISTALTKAVSEEQEEYRNVHWAEVGSYLSQGKLYPNVISYGHRLFDRTILTTHAKKNIVFQEIVSIGGRRGWYYANVLWKIRGAIDTLVGGIGLRRGRRNANALKLGDTVDFFRVEKIEPHALLLLRAEMRLPGRAWLQFEVYEKDGKTEVCETAIFDPKGLVGLLYWYVLLLPHRLIFVGLLKTIIKRAEQANHGKPIR